MSHFPRRAPGDTRSHGSRPRRASWDGDLRGSQSTSQSSAVGAVALIAAGLVLVLVGTGVHAAFAVLGNARPRIPVAGVPIASSAAPTPSAASPSRIVEPEPSVRPTPPLQRSEQARPSAIKPKVPSSGPGTFVSAKIGGRPAGSGWTVVNFHVRREKNLSIDVEAAARTIQAVLNDERSWRGTGKWEFKLVSSAARADVHVYIATPATTDSLCAPLLTRGEVSCQNGNRVILNAKRWILGAETYGTDLANYRRYLVNHEFGHALGYQHTQCAGKGKAAGIMVQQTKGLDGCRPNPWPYPKG